MKTAVSIPDDVFADAERLAAELNVSRSELYANALRSLIAEHDFVTTTLNRVHADVPVDPAATSAARRVFRNTQW